MCIDMCMDMYIDLCLDMYYRYVYGHMYRYVYRHLYSATSLFPIAWCHVLLWFMPGKNCPNILQHQPAFVWKGIPTSP